MSTVLTGVVEALDGGIADGLHLGWQLYVSHHGRVVVDSAGGEAAPGVPMSTDTLMVWFSATKALTAVAAAQQWERGGFDLDDPVVSLIPEFGANDKHTVTMRHLFTHTAGIRFPDIADPQQGGRGAGRGLALDGSGYSPFVAPWDERLRRIVEAELEPDWVPGCRAGYHPFSTMFLLAEVVQRLDGRPFPRYVREEVCQPLGMDDSWIGMPVDMYHGYGRRIGRMYVTRPGVEPIPVPLVDTEEGCTTSVPAGAGRGPIRELGRFYEAMLRKGTGFDGSRILGPTTAEAMVARHRVGMLDETFGIVMDWGLGFIIDAATYGRHASSRSFGHGGGQSSVGFADPEHGLAVALVMNGLPGPDAHYKRLGRVMSRVYEELGLAEPGDPGRERPIPGSGVV